MQKKVLNRKMVIEAIDSATFMFFIMGGFTMALFGVYGSVWALWRLVFMVIPFVVNLYIRQIAKSFVVLLGLHIILPIVFFVTSDGEVGHLWMTASVFMALHSLHYFFRKKMNNNGAFILVSAVLFIMTALPLWGGSLVLGWVYAFLWVLIATGQKIVINMLHMDITLENTSSSSSIPVGRIISFNYRLMAGLGVVMVVLTMAIFISIVPIINSIPITPREIHHSGEINVQHETREWAEQPRLNQALAPFEYEEAETSFIWIIFDILMRIAFTILSILMVCYAMFIITRWLLKFLKQRKEIINVMSEMDLEEDEREFIFPESAKKIKRKHINEHPTRRLFRETIQKHIKLGVPIKPSDTPTEIAARITTDNINGLVEEYVQVRYKK